MPNKTPEQIIDKYQRGVAGASQDYAAGVQNPSKDWASATVAGAERWRTGLQNAMTNRSFERGVQAAGNAKWQQNAATKGAQRYSAAAPDAAQAYAKVAAQVMAAGNAAKSAAGNLPNATIDQRLNRAVVAMRSISEYWKSRARG